MVQGMSDLARAKWRSSGLTDEQAATLQFEALPAERLPQMAGNLLPVPSLFLPYFDLDGRRTDFYRVRYLAPPPGFGGVVEKPQRYAQPAGTVNEVYLPPLLPEPWRAVAGDPTRTLYVTEGELKAAKACASGLPTVGLGGVDVWRSAKQGIPLLSPLDQFAWKGREVVILFDSDAHTNTNVVRAQRQFAQEMTRVWAKPRIAALPAAADGGKQGLDDYLLVSSADDLLKLIEAAPGYSEADVLWDLNERVVYVRDPGVVIDRRTRQKMLPGPFQAHHFSNVVYHEQVSGPKGTARIVAKPAADRWMKWGARAQLQDITYAPGQPEVVDDSWNDWQGWGCEPEHGDVRPWKELLDAIFSHDSTGRRWFEQWCAYPLQHPGVKMYTACVLWSTIQGVGKTLIGYSLGAIYGSNYVEIRKENLESAFNEWACGRQFILGDEITGDDNRAFADRIKGIITRQNIEVNRKHQPLYTIPDTINYLFTSQHPDAFFLEDTDRRFFIHEVVYKAPQDFFQRYDAWLWEQGGAKYLFQYLLDLDLSGFDPKAGALVTAAKREMIADTKSDLATWVMQLANDPTSALGPAFEEAAWYADLWTSEQLLLAYTKGDERSKVTANGMAREMKRAGFRRYRDGQQVDLGGPGRQRVFVLRNLEKWNAAGHTEVAEHWNAHFAKKAPKYHGPEKADKEEGT